MSSELLAPGLRICTGPDDPRLHDVDADFTALLRKFQTAVTSTGKRLFHGAGACMRGHVEFVDGTGIAVHPFFAAGKRYPLIARYSNGESPDDIAPGTRGVSLLWLDPDGSGESPFNLTLNTGRALFAGNAAAFVRFLLGNDQDRQDMVRASPRAGELLWEQVRDPVSFMRYHYHSQAPRVHVDATGRPWLARYRLVPAEDSADCGRHVAGHRLFPPVSPHFLPRSASDRRPPTALRDELVERVSNGGFGALLQIQLHPVTDSADGNRAALDPSVVWSAGYHTIARVRFDAVLDTETAKALVFDPAQAPEGLGIALARSPFEAASVNHARALIYRKMHAARTAPVEARVEATVEARGTRDQVTGSRGPLTSTVCVVGAGPSGLTVARELERLGHTVVVLEREPVVGGKAVSIDVDGHAYDLGAHICTPRYERFAELAAEFGVDTEEATATYEYDADRWFRRSPGAAFFRRSEFSRYTQLREQSFPGIATAGLAHSAGSLLQPISEWVVGNDLLGMTDSLGSGYTASGYGYPHDDIPALYFVKHVEMTGLVSLGPRTTGHAGPFTVSGGFGRLWQRVADSLSDVRTGTRITSIERASGGVVVHTDSGPVHADSLVLSVPLDQVVDVLDATADERDIASRVRTIDYYTVLCRISGLPRAGMYLVRSKEAAPPPGHCVAYHNRYADTDVYTCYSYGARGLDTADIVRKLRADVAAMGGQVTEVLVAGRWPFMPHFSAADLKEGVLDRLERMQGDRQTYHVGSLLGFELIETNVAYAQDLARRYFAAPVADDSRGQGRLGAPRYQVRSGAELLEWLTRQLAAELGRPVAEIDPQAPLDDYGLDSLTATGLQAELSDWLGFRVPPTLLLEHPTLEAVARQLVMLMDGEHADTLEAERKPVLAVALTPPRPFFCVGGAVGAAHQLQALADDLGPGYPFYGLQAPGYDGGEPALKTVEELADRYLEDIYAVQPRGPYVIGGYSFGGLVAYEIGCRLRRDGAEVAEVVGIDSYLPRGGQTAPVWDERAALEELVAVHRAMSGAQGDALKVDPALTSAQCRELVIRELRIMGAAAADRLLDQLLPVFQSNLEANIAYRPQPSDLSMTLLSAVEPFPPVFGEARRPAIPVGDPHNGWASVQMARLRVHEVPGNHFTIIGGADLRGLAATLRKVLDETLLEK
ncbi:FAD-dependent oxidoreductase [Saccharopolyspora hattusasensis]|uniref:FAD-dependent oxidoreductase n=1 Tax=Saccharopolyspora hattusasensis TaxID=1128679 RepID=UPI003D96C8DF